MLIRCFNILNKNKKDVKNKNHLGDIEISDLKSPMMEGGE